MRFHYLAGMVLAIGGWQSDDGLAYGVITRDENSLLYGLLVLRRRVDHVWVITSQTRDISSYNEAFDLLNGLLKEGQSPEPLPPNTGPRPPLYNLNGRKPSDLFELLLSPTHHVAAWVLHQLYLAIPSPDANWASDCQTDNFHARLWEAQLLACFKEQGLLVSQPHPSPNFL